MVRAKAARHFMSFPFITVMHTSLKVPAKNSPALLFLSRGKSADCCCFSFFFFFPAEEEQSRGILGRNFQTFAHDGNKGAEHKVTGWAKGLLNGFLKSSVGWRRGRTFAGSALYWRVLISFLLLIIVLRM